jgi:hypothetical protein
MSLYLVGFDLAHSEEFGAYEYFHAELQKSHAQRVLRRAAVLRSSLNADAIRDSLVRFVHRDDRIVVAEISEKNWAAWKAMAEISDV